MHAACCMHSVFVTVASSVDDVNLVFVCQSVTYVCLCLHRLSFPGHRVNKEFPRETPRQQMVH